MRYYEPERREFVRVQSGLSVQYRYLSHDDGFGHEEKYEGTTTNVSAGGLLLTAQIPDLDWIPAMLMERIFLGVELEIPEVDGNVIALTRVAWIEAVDPGSGECAVGLRFKEITREDLDRVFRFVINSQMP